MHAALACSTSTVRCGSLVYSVGYRHPAVLAKAILPIDQLSGGRADMGIGAGWAEVEYNAYGIPFPSIEDAHGPAGGGHPVPARPAARRGHRLRRRVVQAHRGPQRAAAGAGQAADLDRRRRREAHAEDRREVRRRVERAVRRAGGVRRQARRAAPPLRRRGPRPGRRSAPRSTPGWRTPRRACEQQFGALAPLRAPPAC